jgi:TrmH family RNA methyltransferase
VSAVYQQSSVVIHSRLYNETLLPKAQCDRFDVVLVSPRNPLNIGAVARAMANFGFERLGVVAPYAPHWREARSAIGAPELLQNAIEASSLAEAVKECTLVIGTGTLTYRKPEQRVISLPSLTALIQQELSRDGRVALVFGPEKHGLTREDLSYCHILVEIPTDPRQPSMNLGQAAAVCFYEIASRCSAAESGPPETEQHSTASKSRQAGTNSSNVSASSGNLDILAALVEEVMIEAKYSPRTMQAANRHSVRLLLRRLNVNSADSKRILGIFRRILWRLRRTANRNVTS